MILQFRDYFNVCHPNMSFSHVVERDGKLSFLDVNFSVKKGSL